mgnify:CR=1 FL=1
MDLQIIRNKIFEVRGCRVMLDYHLAELYQVETRALKQAVKRNIERFPSDFMFVLTKEEANLLLSIGVSQNVIPPDYNFGVAMPMAFTEQGVAMLSSFQNSHRGEHFNHAGFCPHAPNGNRLRGTVKAHRGTGGKHRCTVQRAISSPYPASKPVEATERTPSGRFRYL